jgi:hypothetical protein
MSQRAFTLDFARQRRSLSLEVGCKRRKMLMHIEIEPQPAHLHAVVRGTFDHTQLADMLKDIFAASSRLGLRKILIDSRTLEGEISLMARYDLGRIAAELQREPIRLAFVVSEDQIWPDRFGENVANNRGVRTKVSTDMAEALEWLHPDAASKPTGGDVK